ncbi:MAG: hypothetical protein A3B23_03595 [Candidatus Colwellbacteria bacterium RIFCSPLOWO2_01_FULL_48_10]|uniref:Uncharacterized protein n=1 Tax=Candidatus Colwellbacteria bacterium RIFCSPLOWO2_01_FULL_48_10 TaxID=1797690 RepID=A0A1G1Z586_9BACT|nr:MAG: hypothetical protein A3B23_03595 [Candidatus Colwellbacteria bacterium RIFCSPLOWO2_01_FULL_48_10]
MKDPRSGQSLMEVLISIAIGALILGSSVVAVTLTLRSSLQSRSTRSASLLLQEMMDNARSIAEGDWRQIYDLDPKGSAGQYKLAPTLAIESGSEDITINGTAYTRFFTVENVARNAAGEIQAAGTDDPSTQKITGHITWTGNQGLTAAEYLTRFDNRAYRVSDWSDPTGYAEQNGLNLMTPGQATLE